MQIGTQSIVQSSIVGERKHAHNRLHKKTFEKDMASVSLGVEDSNRLESIITGATGPTTELTMVWQSVNATTALDDSGMNTCLILDCNLQTGQLIGSDTFEIGTYSSRHLARVTTTVTTASSFTTLPRTMTTFLSVDQLNQQQ